MSNRNPILDFRAPILNGGGTKTNPSTTSATPPATTGGGGFLGADGFLSKAGETALDLAGLFAETELRKAQIENAGSNRGDPEVQASQARAGVLPFQIPNLPDRFTPDRTALLVMGGIAAVGITAAIIVSNRKS